MTRSVSEVGEHELVRRLIGGIPQHPRVRVGPGDDAAVVATHGREFVASTDLLVEGRHFRRDWSAALDVGHKAAAQNMADIAAMGARPTALLLGLGGPPDLSEDWATDLVSGLVAEAEPQGCCLIGGDTVSTGGEGSPVVVAVTALGDMEGREPVMRSGARDGDVVAIAGRLGWAAAGVDVLSRGFRSPRAVVAAHRRPVVDYAAGVLAAKAGAHAMMDVSDGLVGDAQHLARASGMAVHLHVADLAPDEQLVTLARAMGMDAQRWVLTGGDDHALLACFPADVALPPPFRAVGRVAEGAGVLLDGVLASADLSGYEHFG